MNVAGGPQSTPPMQKDTVRPAESFPFVDKVIPSEKVAISPEGKAKVEGESSGDQSRTAMQQLAKLKTKDDEASLAQQKALEGQIAALNSQIMSLVGMKMEMLEQGKE